METFKILSSSAGSGKTYNLTKYFLGIALGDNSSGFDPFYFKRILAVTFTNDAAAEMKSRVMSTLKNISKDEMNPNYEGIFKDLINFLEIDEKEIKRRSALVYHNILENYSDLSIKTIDSFINQIVQNFTLDFSLSYNYSIELNSDAILRKAIIQLFDKVGRKGEDGLSKIIEEYVGIEFEEEKNSTSLIEQLFSSSKIINNEAVGNALKKDKDLLPKDYFKIRDNIKKFKDDFFESIHEIALKIKNLTESVGLKLEDYAYGSTGFGASIQNLINKDEESIKKWPSTRAYQAFSEGKWFSKAEAINLNNFSPIESEVTELCWQIYNLLKKEKFKFLLLEQIRKNIAKNAMFNFIAVEQDKILSEEEKTFIPILNQKIFEEVSTQPVPYIYERIGERYRHILIDEFQDTSSINFFNFLPLIENNISNNNINLIVGDPKQSIYGFRGSDMRLMIDLQEKRFDSFKESNQFNKNIQGVQLEQVYRNIHVDQLETNYRSAKEIVEFNNSFFSELREKYKDDFNSIVFQDVIQKTSANSKTGGHVSIYSNSEEESLIPILVKECIENGYALNDILILTRNKKESSAIAMDLKKHNIKVKSQDSILFGQSLVLNFIVACLQVINNENDSYERIKALVLFFILKFERYPSTIEVKNFGDLIENNSKIENFYSYFEKYGLKIEFDKKINYSVYQLAEEIAIKFELYEYDKEIDFLSGFLDYAYEYGNQKNYLLGDFLEKYENEKFKLSINSSNKLNAVNLATIHKVKGLEYKVVILNTEGFKSKSFSGNISIEDLEYPELNSGGKKLHNSYINFTKELQEVMVGQEEADRPSFLEVLRLENIKNKTEDFNLLYVAMTRAIERLVIIEGGNSNSIGGSPIFSDIKEVISRLKGTEIDNKIIFSEGKWPSKIEENGDKNEVIAIPSVLSQASTEKLKIKKNPILALEKQKEFGNKIHEAFSLINTKNDINKAIKTLLLKGIINENEVEEIKKKLEFTINLSEIKDYYDPKLKSLNERDILVENEDFYRPDRVIFKNDKAIIMDYKTGNELKSHQDQIKKYGNLLSEMGYLSVDKILVYIELNKAILVD